MPGLGDDEQGGPPVLGIRPPLHQAGLDEVGDARRGVSAQVRGTSATINMVLVIQAGHAVPEVTEAVRATVIAAVEAYGVQVDRVDIKVDDVALGGTAGQP